MKNPKTGYVRVDARNRVSLTKVSKNLPELFRVYKDGDRIILEPIREIPETEKWLFKAENRHILEKLKAGLEQKGTIDRGSFLKFLEDADDKKSGKQ